MYCMAKMSLLSPLRENYQKVFILECMEIVCSYLIKTANLHNFKLYNSFPKVTPYSY